MSASSAYNMLKTIQTLFMAHSTMVEWCYQNKGDFYYLSVFKKLLKTQLLREYLQPWHPLCTSLYVCIQFLHCPPSSNSEVYIHLDCYALKDFGNTHKMMSWLCKHLIGSFTASELNGATS
ncbi:hypothetical protein AMECASPLE_005123 [Ameca splendens]|uniref:Uncharacterized protein n=1 Tax=Ameca splendens TaxID=208324 RepID=A0ABV0YLP7_9TELE